MRFVLYVAGWTVVCIAAFLPLRDNLFWPIAAFVFGFIWLVGIPVVLARVSERMTESLPDDGDDPSAS